MNICGIVYLRNFKILLLLIEFWFMLRNMKCTILSVFVPCRVVDGVQCMRSINQSINQSILAEKGYFLWLLNMLLRAIANPASAITIWKYTLVASNTAPWVKPYNCSGNRWPYHTNVEFQKDKMSTFQLKIAALIL